MILKGAPVTFTANFSFGVDYPEGGRNAVARAISLIISPGPGSGAVTDAGGEGDFTGNGGNE